MAIWFADDSKTYGVQAELRADGTSDVSDLPDFATEHNLKAGSSCLVISNATLYMLDSNDMWKAL